MPASVDVFVVGDGSQHDPVDQLGKLNCLEPYPATYSEIVYDPEVSNHTPAASNSRDNLLSPLLRIQNYDSFQIATVHPANRNLPILQHFFDISNIFCTCPFTRHCTRTCWPHFRLVVYWLLIASSCLDALISINIAFTRDQTKLPHRYTEMGFHAVELVCRFYHVLSLWSLSGKLHIITRLLLRLDDSFSKLMSLVRRQPVELPCYNALTFLFGILPLMAATLWGVFDFWEVHEWNLFGVLFVGARDIGRTFLVWDMGQWDLANNKTDSLLFEHNPDAVWIGLGLLRIWGKIGASLQDFAMRNLLLAISLSLIKHTIPLSKVFKKLGNQLANEIQYGPGRINEIHFEEAWKYYFRLRKVSAEINKTFSGLVKFIHMTNMLMLMYFMLTVVMKQQTPITFVLFLYDISMVVLFYIFGTMINDVNDNARKWIKDNANPTSPVEVDGRTLQILLDDIRQAPVGIGSGIWFVDGSLVQRFVGLVSSLLMFMLDAESQSGAQSDLAV